MLGDCEHGLAVGTMEGQDAVVVASDLISVLVDRAMVVSAEQYQVGQDCRPTVCPMADVMSLDESSLASREATYLITT
jgi:hypothetical protein